MCVRQFIRELDPAGQAVCQLAVHPPDLMVRGHSKPTQSTVSSPLAPKCLTGMWLYKSLKKSTCTSFVESFGLIRLAIWHLEIMVAKFSQNTQQLGSSSLPAAKVSQIPRTCSKIGSQLLLAVVDYC